MFPVPLFGVAVTVAEVAPWDDPDVQAPRASDDRPLRLHEALPAEHMSDDDLAREIQASSRVESLVAAYRVERVAQLAARPSSSGWVPAVVRPTRTATATAPS